MQYKPTVIEKYEARPRVWWLYTLIVVILAILLGWSGSSVEFRGVTAKGSEVASGIFFGLVRPDFSMLFSAAKEGVPYLLLETVCIAILGTIIGGILALPFAFLQKKRDIASAMVSHGIVDAVRFTLMGI